MGTFLATLSPMLTLFFCIAIGFCMSKTKLLPDSASKTMAKMETWIFCPALSFMTMACFCTLDTFATNAFRVGMGCATVLISIAIAIPLSYLFARKDQTERGVYRYALAFANFGYMGDPIVLTLFGEEILSYYKLFTLPFSILVYVWGIGVLTPKSDEKWSSLRRLLNAPTIATFVGIAVGLTGLGGRLPAFFTSAVDSLKACMGPVAMLLAGVTIAKYNVLSMLKNKRVYLATALRLFVIPAFLVLALSGIKLLLGRCVGESFGNDVLFLAFFATATPLGLNTVVFPEAYGGSPETGAGMALISHTLCIVSIPILYALMVLVFGIPFGG